MFYRLASSDDELGTLVLGNFVQDPPQPYESAPEYSIASKKASKAPIGKLIIPTEIYRESPLELDAKVREKDSKVGDLERLDAIDRDVTTTHSVAAFDARSRSTTHSESEVSPNKQFEQYMAQQDHRNHSATVSASKFHVWCLGTIWLRLITWFILGPDGMRFSEPDSIFYESPETFQTSGFFEEMPNDAGYTANPSNSHRINPVVVELIEKLQRHEDCTASVKRILTLIRRRMLVIDPTVRASSQEVMEMLEEINLGVKKLQNTKEEMVPL